MSSSKATRGLLALACFYTLYFAKDLFLPIILALLLYFIFRPVVRSLRRAGMPPAVGAAFVLAGLVAAAALATYQFSRPATEWLAKAPRSFREISNRIADWKKPVEQMTRAAEEAQRLADVASKNNVPEVEIRKPSLGDVVLAETWALMLGGFMVLTLLYFFLASGDLFLERLIRAAPYFNQERAVGVAHQIEAGISRYLVTLTVMNVVLGGAVALLLYLFEIPNPALWGTIAALLNYVPYAGALATAVILAAVSASALHDLGQGLLIVAIFLLLTSIEGALIRPLILGRQLALNPLAVFLAIALWGWMWGIAGVLLAVPILAVIKVFVENLEKHPSYLSEFLAG